MVFVVGIGGVEVVSVGRILWVIVGAVFLGVVVSPKSKRGPSSPPVVVVVDEGVAALLLAAVVLLLL